VVHPGHNKSGKSPFNEEIVTKYMESVVKENPGLIDGYFIVKRGLLGVIYGTAKELGYNVKSIGAGDDRMEDYKKQSEYLKKAGGDFPSDVEVIETPRSTSGTEIRDSIQNEDFLKFKKLVPSSVSSFYNTLVSSINGKAIAESEDLENLEDISESKKADLTIKKEKRNSSKK
jgi:hypothetical protein